MPRQDLRRYRLNFTREAARVVEAMRIAAVGTVALATAAGKPKAWLSQRIQGHRRLRHKDSETLLQALAKIRITRKEGGKLGAFSAISPGNSAGKKQVELNIILDQARQILTRSGALPSVPPSRILPSARSSP